MIPGKAQLRWASSVFAIVVAGDQLAKLIIRATIEPDFPFQGEVFFHFTHQRNVGIVGGMFRDYPFVGYLMPPLALALLVYLYRYLDRDSRLQSIAFGMVLGGAIGNMLDRLFYRAVTDYLQFYFYFVPFDFPWKYYPAFNIADSAIMTGSALLVITWNMGREEHASDTP